ncbi:MAG: hypothetical protein ACLTBD_09230, partial [Clostridia bacterium]
DVYKGYTNPDVSSTSFRTSFVSWIYHPLKFCKNVERVFFRMFFNVLSIGDSVSLFFAQILNASFDTAVTCIFTLYAFIVAGMRFLTFFFGFVVKVRSLFLNGYFYRLQFAKFL